MTTTLILLAILVLILVLMYNSLVNKKNQVENIFASVDTQLKKRHDLIPNLIASVKQYMAHEKSLLESVTSLRTKSIKHNLDEREVISLDDKMSSALGSLMIAVEAYPELKANENIMQLQSSLNEVEEQIQASRRAYNQAVTDYNNALEMIPTNFIAKAMSYEKKSLFEIKESQKENINVKELFDN
ncbi:MAG: LemA family protein [Halarcobacter sp.]